ncbi:MAG: BamA/TamA family outer membrane protein [Bacteroidales bacterium]|nr:BamA/TamA family outer membrane protein [Bacteroidales bacterium]
MKRIMSLTLSFHFAILTLCYSQSDTNETKPKEKVKTGWTFGAVPAIAFDSDIGFKYGGVVNFFYYGDGSTYPKYLHSLYFEWSRTTKGSGINQFTYDSEHLIPNIRVSAEASYLTEQALDFYGFNGYKAYYNHDLEDDESESYISRMYYRINREHLRLRLDFQGKIIDKKLRWLTGFTHNNIEISTVDIDKLNKGKSNDEMLPDTALLYDQFVEWGFIPEDQKDGGNCNLIKVGIIYDTRDNEPNPMKGMWTTLQFVMAPSFLGNKDCPFTKMVVTHRQYFTLIPERMNLAMRMSYQDKITGEMPFYMLPFIYNSAPSMTRDGLGGAKTMRGIVRNRVVGDDYLYGNIELRYKLIKTVIFNQNFYLALSGFTDYGMATGEYKIADNHPYAAANEYIENGSTESIHLSCGGGLHFALNENFIVAVDYGRALDKRDGVSGLYINLNWLY